MKEGFIVQGGLTSLHKLLSAYQQKLSDEDKDLLPFKDSKLTYLLSNVLREDAKVSIIFHLSVMESTIENCLKTLEISERIKATKPTNTALTSPRPSQNADGDEVQGEEINIDQII